MSYAMLKQNAHSLFEQAPFISHISNKTEYNEALKLMDELINDYEYNKLLIEVLSYSIEQWEDNADEYAEFNKRIEAMSSGVSTLKLLMTEYRLGVADFPEIGSKSLLSKILNGERDLTKNHIYALSKRFNVSPSLFFEKMGIA